MQPIPCIISSGQAIKDVVEKVILNPRQPRSLVPQLTCIVPLVLTENCSGKIALHCFRRLICKHSVRSTNVAVRVERCLVLVPKVYCMERKEKRQVIASDNFAMTSTNVNIPFAEQEANAWVRPNGITGKTVPTPYMAYIHQLSQTTTLIGPPVGRNLTLKIEN